MTTLADAIVGRDALAIREIAAVVLSPDPDNFVERPWGGRRILAYKGIDASLRPDLADKNIGECFELSACDADPEARAHPSVLSLPDGSRITLPKLLSAAGDDLLGADFVARHGAGLPLLPKTLDVAELLSVQAHPPGNVEAYVVVDADPGATIRLGFVRDVDKRELGRDLVRGRILQEELGALVGARVTPLELQGLLVASNARRDASIADLARELGARLGDGASPRTLESLLRELSVLRWSVLDMLNEVPVRPDQVLFNATPARLSTPGRALGAEVHALGNPSGKEIIILEIRRPGPTLRAWDHVRFPMRPLDVEASIDAFGLSATTAVDFEVHAHATGNWGVELLVECDAFVLERVRSTPDRAVEIAASPVHTLHCIRGAGRLVGSAGRLATIARGASALVPCGVAGYRIEATSEATELIRVTMPV